MKTNLFSRICCSLLALVIFHGAYAQTASKSFVYNAQDAVLASQLNDALAPAKTSEKATTDELNAKAIKHFKKQFKEVSNASWSSFKGGFLAYFKQDGVTTRVYYNRNGAWQFNLKQYSEDLMPRALRAAVKSTYFDFSIICVDEIESSTDRVYIVHLEDKTTLKKLRIDTEGNMDIIEDFEKA
jgi:hypothetical protein